MIHRGLDYLCMTPSDVFHEVRIARNLCIVTVLHRYHTLTLRRAVHTNTPTPPTCNHDISPSRISDSASTSDHCAFPRDTFAFTSGSTVLLRRARPKSDCPENLSWPPLCAKRVTDHTRRMSLILSSPSHILHARTVRCVFCISTPNVKGEHAWCA